MTLDAFDVSTLLVWLALLIWIRAYYWRPSHCRECEARRAWNDVRRSRRRSAPPILEVISGGKSSRGDDRQ